VTWTDDLTAPPSRRALLTAHHQAFDAGAPTGLVLADLNGFKHINDTHGHPTGDHVLQVIATRMTTIWGPDVLVARLGGDEFAVLTTTPHGWPDAPKPPSTHSPPRSRPRPAPPRPTSWPAPTPRCTRPNQPHDQAKTPPPAETEPTKSTHDDDPPASGLLLLPAPNALNAVQITLSTAQRLRGAGGLASVDGGQQQLGDVRDLDVGAGLTGALPGG
jgi:hypothetical protein